MIGLVGGASIVLVAAGCILPVFTVDATGLIVDMIHFEEEEGRRVDTVSLGLIIIAKRLVHDVLFLDDGLKTFGCWFFAIFLVLTVLVAPILCVCGLLVQWFYPLRKHTRTKVVYFTECAHAWQYTGTLLLSVLAVVATLQFSDISRSMLGRYCEAMGATLLVSVQAGLMEGGEILCYVVTSSVEIGFLLLLVGVFCVSILHDFISSASDQVRRAESMPKSWSSTSIGNTSLYHDDDTQGIMEQLDAPSTVFTDRYRWFVYPAKGPVWIL